MNGMQKRATLTLLSCGLLLPLWSQKNQYKVEANILTGIGEHAPFYLQSGQYGVFGKEVNQGVLTASLYRTTERTKGFDYGYGLELAASYNNTQTAWVQQLYGEIQYGWFRFLAGSKQQKGLFREEDLSSGGTIWSGNARPIPQIEIAFNDFHALPFTKGWLELYALIAYGYFIDSPYLKDQYTYQNSFITTDGWYHHKSLFFRSKSDRRFVFTIGAEFAAQFGGHYKEYKNGKLHVEHKNKVGIKDFVDVLIPQAGGSSASVGDQAYYYGNHLGAWHIMGAYRLNDAHKVTAYCEWLFEDGSGIGKMNGLDGLWGLEYEGAKGSLISNFVLEYIQTTNQGGPIHWAPGDHTDTSLSDPATGADDYYNNYFYTGWAHFGQANGNPFLISPIYDDGGYLRFRHSRIRGVQVAVKGSLTKSWSYVAKYGHNKGWGSPYIPLKKEKMNAALLATTYNPSKLKGWEFSGKVAFDQGGLIGNNWAIQVGVIKKGIIK